MASSIPRLRMFAGPNGSGKSTIKSVIPASLLGVYINPDEIEATIRDGGFLDLMAFGVESTVEEIRVFFRTSTLLQKAHIADVADGVTYESGKLRLPPKALNAYLASVTADFLRRKLIDRRMSLSFETVMSSPDKIDLLRTAQDLGYRTYLYYVATEDPIINVSRVRNRVLNGGHDVPEEKIFSRYARSLDLLPDAIRCANRAYIFDNSSPNHLWIAEVTDGQTLKIMVEELPVWFQRAVLSRMAG